MGGSELIGLHEYKTKFTDENKGYQFQMNWVVSQFEPYSKNDKNSLFVVYDIAKRKSNTDISINQYKDDFIINPFVANYKIIRFWLVIDIL